MSYCQTSVSVLWLWTKNGRQYKKGCSTNCHLPHSLVRSRMRQTEGPRLRLISAPVEKVAISKLPLGKYKGFLFFTVFCMRTHIWQFLKGHLSYETFENMCQHWLCKNLIFWIFSINFQIWFCSLGKCIKNQLSSHPSKKIQ